jgi:hypothetical protein
VAITPQSLAGVPIKPWQKLNEFAQIYSKINRSQRLHPSLRSLSKANGKDSHSLPASFRQS